MITGIDIGLAQDYISKYDKGEPKTIWKIGVLSVHAFSYVASKLSDANKSIEAMIDIVKFGLRGFDNFRDKEGKNVQFETESQSVSSKTLNIVSNNIISIIPTDIIVELGSKILEITKLSEQEIKN